MKEFLKDLNEDQYKAATTLEGPLLVIACAGSGKTYLTISRVANLISDGVDPKNILLLTFTKKAAGEMKNRVCSFKGIESGKDVTATTFHSFCNEILRKYANVIGFNNNFSILDDAKSKDAISMFSKQHRDKYKKIKTSKFPTDATLQDIHGRWISNMQTIEDICDYDTELDLDPNYRNDVIEILTEYNKYKKDHNMMDFDDLMYYTYQLLRHHENIRAKLDKHYRYIMCDEYQDTNVIQDALLDLLSKDYPNLCVVGDDMQSIYRWRGAKIENILTFSERHNNCPVIKLTTNYRSTQEILDFANAVASNALEGVQKDMVGISHGQNVKFRIYENDRYLSDEITWEIQRRILAGENPNEICVMGRNGNSTYYLESALKKSNIPYKKFGGPSFFDIKVIRDILAFLEATDSTQDEISWARVLELFPKIGMVKARKIFAMIEKQGLDVLDTLEKETELLKELKTILQGNIGKPPVEQINNIQNFYADLSYKKIEEKNTTQVKKDEEFKRLEMGLSALDSLKAMAREYKSVREMLDDFALNVPDKDDDTPKVNVTTVHSAKGLEYDVVYLINPVQGTFPRKLEDTPETREDLRCMYVAVTRPRKELYVCYAKEIVVFGKYSEAMVSTFYNHENVLETCDYPAELLDMMPEEEHKPVTYGSWDW